MSLQLDKIAPWGRSKEEYELMFGLTPADLGCNILGCGDGPASFNAEMTQRGGRIVSCDPIYEFSGEEIENQFDSSVEPIMREVRAHPQNYVWSYHRDPENLLRHRKAVLDRFLADYPTGLAEGRYIVGELPKLPFAENSFDLALCSHLLFLYSTTLSQDFHFWSLLDLCRVAKEVRIFPITDLACEISSYLVPLRKRLAETGVKSEVLKVPYQLQRNGDAMMRVWRDQA